MKRIFLFFMVGVALTATVPAGAVAYKGDFNGDGKVDMTDFAILSNRVASGSDDKTFDLSTSGKVDEADLHILANLIINEQLIEDNGVNVGIGGWEDTGEDWGGVVNAPAAPRQQLTRAGGDARVELDRMAYDYSIGQASFDIMLRGADSPSAVLINLELPMGVLLKENYLSLCNSSLSADAMMTGTPIIKRSGDREFLRFIVSSPSLASLRGDSERLATIMLAGVDKRSNAVFPDCKAVMPGSEEAFDLPHKTHYDIRWKYIPVSSISYEEDIVSCLPGDRVERKVIVLPEDATNKDLEYSTSNPDVAELDGWYTWVVYVLQHGQAVITARTVDGSNLTASYIIDTNQNSIEASTADRGPVTVYDLYGRHIATIDDPSSLPALPAGCYILCRNGVATKVMRK